MSTHSGVRALAILASLAITSWACADLSDTVYAVEISKEVEGGEVTIGYYAVDVSQGTWDPETGGFSWYLGQDVIVTDFAGVPVGTLQAYNEATGQGSYITVAPQGGRSPYQVNLGFAVQAGDAMTSFSFGSALLSFPTIASPEGRADTVINLTDFDGDGATLTGLKPGGGAYLAQYNGFPNGTAFTELQTAPVGVGAFESLSVNDAYGFAPIGVPVSNMSSLIEFSLTGDDLASGSSTYVITPEPAAALLLLAGLMAMRRR